MCCSKIQVGVNWCFGHLHETLREPTDGAMKLFFPPNERLQRGDYLVWMYVSKAPRKQNMLYQHKASQRLASASPGRLVKTQIAELHPQSFSLSKSEVRPENLCFSQVPR